MVVVTSLVMSSGTHLYMLRVVLCMGTRWGGRNDRLLQIAVSSKTWTSDFHTCTCDSLVSSTLDGLSSAQLAFIRVAASL